MTAVISCLNSCLTTVPIYTQPMKLKFGTQHNFMTMNGIPNFQNATGESKVLKAVKQLLKQLKTTVKQLLQNLKL